MDKNEIIGCVKAFGAVFVKGAAMGLVSTIVINGIIATFSRD